MSEEEIRKMCNDIYEGERWQPMIDLIQSKDKEIERLNKIIKWQENKIAKLSSENVCLETKIKLYEDGYKIN